MVRTRPRITAVVPAAGTGTRIGGKVPKQFLLLAGKPVLVHTLERFERCADVDQVCLAVPPSAVAETESMVSRYRLHKVRTIVAGGAKRQDSVANALRGLTFGEKDIILVHDAVRPFIEPKSISEVIRAAREYNAAVVAVQPKDTVRRANGSGFFDTTIDRSALWLIQTPQAFTAPVLLKAFERAAKDRFTSTDEAGLVERLNVNIRIVHGSYDNIKITTPEDLELGLLILQRWSLKGLG
ncbi:MAG: 2-C-methyl-D-erythritol 4-phosphate cytidylyltransferase [Bacteroidota bacterium]